MATFDAFTPARRAPSMGVFSNLMGRIIAWNDRRVTLKMLRGLTDRELSDIGLERGDITTWSSN
ncbi:Uncharacterized conserved protein YjiS, DUF1127 family [Jannaschia faecimaris]|uniref:Uncharacterized conserved protein YjiS, DUF1127 family n=1 Tax=Jannaschia faecimaris TaxID=1244108 RepID=A0A1H3L7Y0_9RHOB|nr:DUF1127 domain-containing protein [Jannaschia faecimaris]SDY60034.1 Uncharacterized conserved protein YjiS, DUF1127 family [Jannaschia faecimaris]